MKRRDFVRYGFAAGIVGLGGLSALASTAACNGAPANSGLAAQTQAQGQATTQGQALTAQHWGLAIDVQALNNSVDFAKIAAACHTNHNVPQIDDPRVEVKWIWEDDFEHCFAEMDNKYLPDRIKELKFPVLCNHCENPVCVRVCPTQATFKREDGIVDMDYHRCIGCRFCMTACPYTARSLNFFDPRLYLDEINPSFPTRTLGVVEKCNFCTERLARGLAPYCVEASEGTIIFGDLEDPASPIRKALDSCLSIRRLPELGTGPSVYYLLRDGDPDA